MQSIHKDTLAVVAVAQLPLYLRNAFVLSGHSFAGTTAELAEIKWQKNQEKGTEGKGARKELSYAGFKSLSLEIHTGYEKDRARVVQQP